MTSHRFRKVPDYLVLVEEPEKIILHQGDKEFTIEVGKTRYDYKKGEVVEEKQCASCDTWKELCMFSKDVSKADLLRFQCKACDSKERNLLEESMRRKIPHKIFMQEGEITIGEKDGEYFFIEEEPTYVEKKMCTRCRKWKPLEKYHKDTRAWDRLNCSCKKCKVVYFNQRRQQRRMSRETKAI
jgi:hypothetical protein